MPTALDTDTDLDTKQDADLGAAFAALGDRTRRAIIGRLARGEATVGELAEPFDLTHQAISRHVGVLRRCGLIHQRVDGQRRPCRLDVERMQELVGWISAQQQEWASRLDRLEEHLASVHDESFAMTADVTLDGDQLIASRYVDATPDLVWAAFTTPAHLAAFWGGDHATVPQDSVTVDLRVGGTFELETLGDDGRRHPLCFRYEVVESPSRLVLAEPRTGITTEIRLRASGRGTTVLVHQRRVPPELQSEQARTGLAGILDRLAVVAGALTDDQRSTP